MNVSMKVRFSVVVLAAAGFSLAHADEGESKRSDVLRILKTIAPQIITQDEEMVSDWQAQRATMTPVVQIERELSERAEMGVEAIEAITFWDDNNRYDLILDDDGAIVLDIEAQTASDSFTFTVGPVPIVKNQEKVLVSTLGVMASKNGNSGTFDLEVDDLNSETAIEAFNQSNAAQVFIESGTVVAFFFTDGELNAALHFSPLDQEVGEDKQLSQEGNLLLSAPLYWLRLKQVCDVLYTKCVDQGNVDACGHWLDHCQQAP